MPRKQAVKERIKTVPSKVPSDEEELEEENDETSMLEMISILQDFQKRKSTKASTKSSAFIAKKQALYAEARKNASIAVQQGTAYIEQYKSVISNLKAQETSQDQRLKELSLFADQEEAVGAILAQYPPIFEDISPRRAETINDTSAMLESHSAERHQSRRRLIRNAKVRIEEDYENQRIATDASALIKHYKAMLRG